MNISAHDDVPAKLVALGARGFSYQLLPSGYSTNRWYLQFTFVINNGPPSEHITEVIPKKIRQGVNYQSSWNGTDHLFDHHVSIRFITKDDGEIAQLFSRWMELVQPLLILSPNNHNPT